MRRYIIRSGIIIAAIFAFCDKSNAQVIELACPAGTTSVQSLQTIDTTNSQIRQNYCIDAFGKVFENNAAITSAQINCTIINLVRCVSDTNPQGWAGTTPDAWISSAMANCPSTGCEIDIALTAPTFASTVTVSKPILFKVIPSTITGPPSGNTILFGAGSSGSVFIGSGATSRGAGTIGNVPITKIISNATNTSNVIAVVNGGNPIQGIRLEHFMVDGANSAANCFFSDTMQTSAWYDLDAENCTSVGYAFTTTSSTLNVGNQLNSLIHLRGFGSPQLFTCNGNAAGTADFTANTIVDLQGNYGVGASSVPGIELINCDGNVFNGVTKPFRASGTGFALAFDGPSGPQKGAFSNQIYQFYGMSSNNVTVASGATGNFIYGYDITNAEPAPVGTGNFGLMWQPNFTVGGAGGIAGMVWPNNTCLAWWNSTGGGSGDCILKFDGSNNLHFISQETGGYFFDSGPGEVSPNTGVTQSLGSSARSWNNLFIANHINQSAATKFAGVSACAASVQTITFATAFTSTPVIVVFDETTKGGINLTAKSASAFSVSCTGATDAFDWIAIGNPN